MDKIYRRPTQLGGTPKKKKDEHARKRNTIINFRVTPREKELIEKRIELSGLPKAEFFIESCLYQAVLVRGNVRTFSAMKENIRQLDEHLFALHERGPFTLAEVESLQTMIDILESFFRRHE